mmetsp:Transcript_15846/g.24379  ORF Transcript_15846/g.24379 Transcript_15846/m.24379 type:complete len:144 (+) Transcript_15846:39-470(+)|eukprot:CAMPEP_0170490836 /NCGR_PEP_ID=MMETSP0208-20121228/9901_1 /TAXON_ID=197538 /ORGANISM="Strombidium inclinatum, Strain S3" /LENGTH=143 /DNA_ID=CAMNT_0010766299 /DNA_START=6 /DNA_END=437 /DNA_ORIENTATION=+
MKIFSTLALLIGAENVFTIRQVEEFVAGIIYGLVQDDDLTEIEACLKDGAKLEDEVAKAVNEIMQGDLPDIIQGIQDLGVVIQELPADLDTCKNIQGDLDRIKAWASIFSDPKVLVPTVTKNVIANFSNITMDIQMTNEDISK